MDNHNNINNDGHVLDLIPEYIEKSLPADQRSAVRAHLETCATCRGDYIELQATRFALKQMPVAAAPRSFAITEEVARPVKKPSFLESLFVPRLAPTFAGGSVVAFVLLVFLFATNSSLAPTSAPALTTFSSFRASETGTPSDQAGLSSSSKLATTAVPAAQAPEEPTSMVDASMPTSDTVTSALIPNSASGVQADATSDADIYSGATTESTQAMPQSVITPNTTVSDSITSSPTTVGYADGKQPGMGVYDGNSTPYVPPSANSVTPALEIGLLALGVALATAAIISRRRTL